MGKERRGTDSTDPAWRAHAESAWALALVVCGSEAQARCAVQDALRAVPTRVRGPEDRAARLEMVATTAEAAALRVFDPSNPGGCGPAIVDLRREPPSKEARVLAMAFARRLSWYKQAALWAVDVEGLPSRATARRLGKGGVRVRLEGVRGDLRRAYLQLRTDLDKACLSNLQQIFRLSPPSAAGTPHPSDCPDCMAQRAWLGDLGVALRILDSPLPPEISEPIGPPRGADDRIAPSEGANHRSESWEGADEPSEPSEGAEDPMRRAQRGRRGSHALRSGAAPRQRNDRATTPRGRRSHARGSRGATERMKASATPTESSTSPVGYQEGTPAVPLTGPLQPPYPAEDATEERGTAPVGPVGTTASAGVTGTGMAWRTTAEPSYVLAAPTGPPPHLPDSSSPGPAEAPAERPAPTAVEEPPTESTTRVSRSPQAPLVTTPDDSRHPTDRAQDHTPINGLEAVANSNPGAWPPDRLTA